jgi:Mycothiol maleylpyruvate isomerase N-terminal domain
MTTATSEWTRARAALSRVTPEFGSLLRGVERPTAPAVGDWTIGDTAAHVAVVADADAYLARGDAAPPAYLADLVERERTATIEDVAVLNRISLERLTERDPRVLADRIEHQVTELLGADDRTGNEPVVWLGGVELPLTSVLIHLLSELILHGFDIARAERRPWRIEPDDAIAVQREFLLRFLGSPGADQFLPRVQGAKDVCAEFRVRGAPPVVFRVRDGSLHVAEPGPTEVDVRVTCDPVAMLFVMYERIRPVLPLLRGQLRVGGRRPWRLPRLMKALQMP